MKRLFYIIYCLADRMIETILVHRVQAIEIEITKGGLRI